MCRCVLGKICLCVCVQEKNCFLCCVCVCAYVCPLRLLACMLVFVGCVHACLCACIKRGGRSGCLLDADRERRVEEEGRWTLLHVIRGTLLVCLAWRRGLLSCCEVVASCYSSSSRRRCTISLLRAHTHTQRLGYKCFLLTNPGN